METNTWDEPKANPDDSNWKAAILDRFASWLDGVSDPESVLAPLAVEDENQPDLYSFYSELATLKQEIRLQTRAVTSASRSAETVEQGLRETLLSQQEELRRTAESLKSAIPAASREARVAVILELLALRENANHTIAAMDQRRLPAMPWNRRARRMLEENAADQRSLRDQMDDTLRRLEVYPLARPGMVFDPKTMRAVSRADGSGVRPGQVAEVLKQGYRSGKQILLTANVAVEIDKQTQSPTTEGN